MANQEQRKQEKYPNKAGPAVLPHATSKPDDKNKQITNEKFRGNRILNFFSSR